MGTLRPVKRFDSNSSNRASLEFASSTSRSVGDTRTETKAEVPKSNESRVVGEEIMRDVVQTTLDEVKLDPRC
jgi:hypothetical protein